MVFRLLCFAPLLVLAGPRDLVQVSGPSPFDGCASDQASMQSGTFAPDSEVEPWLVVNPRNHKHLVATWQQDRWSNGGARGLVTAVSTDGGRSWRKVLLPGLTFCSGGQFLRASDPWLTFAPNGDLYHMSLLVTESLIDLLEGQAETGRSAMAVQKSEDGGFTWSEPIYIVNEDFAGVHDKNSITADPFDPRFVYAVWDRDELGLAGPALFSRTTDGGLTWEAPRLVHDPGPFNGTVGCQIVILPDGTLMDFFTQYETEGELTRFYLAFKLSPDRGETWLPQEGSAIAAELLPSLNLVDPQTGGAVRGGEFLFDVAVDPRSGMIYAVWQDSRFSALQHEAIALSVSSDDGMTWTVPAQVNKTPADLPPAKQQAFIPSVAVNDRGDVAITYYDFRFDGAEPEALTDYWAITCHPRHAVDCINPSSWSAEIRLTDHSFDLLTAPIAGGKFLGDYAGLTSAGSEFVAAFPISSATDPANLFVRRFKPGARGLSLRPQVERFKQPLVNGLNGTSLSRGNGRSAAAILRAHLRH